MKKIYLALFLLVAALGFKASTNYTITIIGTPAYSPSTLTVQVGDMVFIQASGTHPCNQVDGGVWNAAGSTTLGSGWGSKTADFTFTATATGTVYYVCQNHVSMGMKGMITVVPAVGFNEYSFKSASFSVFPNPAIDKITIKTEGLKENPEFTLYNSVGMAVSGTVIRENAAKTDEIEVVLPQNLSSGIYFAVLTKNEARLVKKIVVTK
jgi:plastocyanin